MIFHQVPNSYGNYNYNARIYQKPRWVAHFHGNYELIYAMEGETEVVLNGVPYRLLPREMILISPYTVHAFTGGEGSKIWVGVFSEDFVSAFAERHRAASFVKFRCETQTEQALHAWLFREEIPDRYRLISCLYMVCDECLKNADCRVDGTDNDFKRRVITYLSENMADGADMETLAKEMGYEYHYFSALFHKCFGMNFKKLLHLFRFEAACRLLNDSTLSMTEIGERCGFGSVRNFNRVFKQISGVTPCEYRK